MPASFARRHRPNSRTSDLGALMLTHLTRAEFLRLAEPSDEPGLAIYLPVGEPGGRAAARRLRQILPDLHEQLQAQGVPPEAADRLLVPARELVDDLEHRVNDHAARALFVRPAWSATYRLPDPVRELIVYSPQLHLKPLIPLLTESAAYHLLSISKGGVQLFAGVGATLEPLALPGAPASLPDLLKYDEFAPQRQLHAGVPGSGGERGPIFHGQGDADDELKPQLLRYCQAIDRALLTALANPRLPLVLCGADYLLAIYRAVSRHPAIHEAAIVGSPERIPPAELAARAWAIVQPAVERERATALERYQALAGTNHQRTASAMRTILAAAFAGQVDTIFVAGDQEHWGRYDATTGQVRRHEQQRRDDTDLLNLAAIETIRRGGTAHVVPSAALPGHDHCAAILRPGAR